VYCDIFNALSSTWMVRRLAKEEEDNVRYGNQSPDAFLSAAAIPATDLGAIFGTRVSNQSPVLKYSPVFDNGKSVMFLKTSHIG
jgi:hypothetical protein